MKHRRVPVAVATAGLLLVLSACSDNDTATTTSSGSVPELSPDQKVSITFESYNLSNAGPWTDTFTALIDQFEAENPNITVTAQKPQGASANGVSNDVSSVQSELATGNPPDVAQLTFTDRSFVVDQLGAQSLDALYGADEVDANFGGEHPFADSVKTLGDVDGQTYGLPFVLSTPVLYYNADLFTEAGLDPDDPPTTWAQFQEDALAIQEKTGQDGGYIDCLTEVAGDWCYQSLLDSAGGGVMSQDQTALSYADDAGIEVVTMAQGLVDSGAMPKLTQTQAVGAFVGGSLGMLVESSSLQGTMQAGAEGNWELRSASLPSFGDQPVVPTNSGAALFVFSQDPAKQAAAWELMKFLTSDTAYTAIASNIGYLPLRTDLVDDPDTLGDWYDENPLAEPNLEQLADIRSTVSFPGSDYVEIRSGMLEAVEDVVFQGADPSTTMTQAQEAGQKLLP